MSSKRIVIVAALALGFTCVVGSSTGFAQSPSAAPAGTPAPTAPAVPAHVQLNADTAVSQGLANKYTNDDFNVALGECLAPGAGVDDGAPASTQFSSPVLTFSNYAFLPTLGVQANVSANAKLKPGTKSGSYPLTMVCEGKSYTATFTVSKQVLKVPAGAPHTGGGGTAH